MAKPFTPIAIVGTVVAGEAAETKAKLESLINTVEKSAFDIADLLYFKMKLKSLYVSLGFSTLREFTNTLKLKPRKAQYLARMAEVMDKVGIQRIDYEPLGIGRLREITSLEPEDSWTNPETGAKTPMVDFIKGFVNYREQDGDYIDPDKLKRHIRTLKGLIGENDLVYETLCMTRLAHEKSWQPAIALAKAHIGSSKKDENGMSIEASTGAAAEKLAIAYLIDPQNELGAMQDTAGEDEDGE